MFGGFRRADDESQEARKAGSTAAILWHRNGGALLHDQVWQLAARYRHVAFAQADVASSEHCAKLAATMQVRARGGWVARCARWQGKSSHPAPEHHAYGCVCGLYACPLGVDLLPESGAWQPARYSVSFVGSVFVISCALLHPSYGSKCSQRRAMGSVHCR